MLHISAKKGYLNIVNMLIQSKYPLDLTTKKGQTATACAAKKGNLKVLKALVKAGSDLNKTDNEGIGPLYLSLLYDHQPCSEYLIGKEA